MLCRSQQRLQQRLAAPFLFASSSSFCTAGLIARTAARFTATTYASSSALLRSFSSSATAATPSSSSSSSDDITIRFPPSKAYLARVAAEKLKADTPKPVKQPTRKEPRHFALRTSTKRHAKVVPAPVREAATAASEASATPSAATSSSTATTIVPWKIQRQVNGLLPVKIECARLETSKPYLKITGIEGDVESLKKEIELFVGPLYEVKVNTVNTAIEVKSTPKTKVTEKFMQEFKDWLIKIGV